YNSSSGTPRTHIAAPGSGKIVYTFGNPTLINNAKWSSLEQTKIAIKQLLLYNGEPLSAVNVKYMFDNQREKCEIAGDRVFNIGKNLCRKVFGPDADDYELSPVDVHSQNTVKTIGTIYCDHDGPLDASSTMLVGSDEMCTRTVRLNFSKIKSVGVFPGQVVMVSGMNPKGDTLTVENIIAEKQLTQPTPPKIDSQLSVVIAAGPYTFDDDILYDPLHDLLNYLKENLPDVLVLTGPFFDVDHQIILENMGETFEVFFERMIAGIVEIIGTSTTVLMVSSQYDAMADPVYPTLPVSLKKTYPNVHMLPDPSMIDLNGIIIGMTSTDVVDHIISTELAINAGDKIKRVVNHLYNQGSFYPLNPPPEDKLCLDSNLTSKFANIEQIPNIIILPSDQKCFIRVVNGSLAINPGRLADNAGGTFARLIIAPSANKDENNFLSNIGCQVRKV
ncbi:DNA polymerase alpha subunit B-like, partial [Teleopsis dalmanni]|uniref:DNA polymerase alpha subunit B-like n=1 Tax=Teleopsis dalmanni TaxID=139649 RepID=UPI0018CFA7A9